jgi:hypothetical protein
MWICFWYINVVEHKSTYKMEASFISRAVTTSNLKKASITLHKYSGVLLFIVGIYNILLRGKNSFKYKMRSVAQSPQRTPFS